MSQHDMTIADQAGTAFLSDLNSAIAALVGNSSGAAAPTTTYAYQFWADTTTGLLKQRSAANSAWITVCKLSNWAMPAAQTQEATAFTSAGTAPAYTLTPDPAIAALAANQRFRVKFHSATTGAATLAVNGLAATAIKQYDSTGAKVDPTIAAGQLADVEYDGTHWVILDPLPPVSNVTTFASAAENAAGAVENKATDPLGIREAFNATGTAPVYACRAWGNFSASTGTPVMRASGNLSGITDEGVGVYTANFLTSLPDPNYSAQGAFGNASYTAINVGDGGSPTASTFRFANRNHQSGVAVDQDYCMLAFFR